MWGDNRIAERGTRRPAGARGLTLVELLVTITLVALLIALLAPALAGARDSARDAACLTNLREMAAGTGAHVASYGYVPPASRAFDYPGRTLRCPLDTVRDRPPDRRGGPACSYATIFTSHHLAGENISRLRMWTALLDGAPHREPIYWDGWEERRKRRHNNFAFYDGHARPVRSALRPPSGGPPPPGPG